MDLDFMAKYRSKLGLSNSCNAPRVVAVEPWADDLTLMPGEELEIVAFGDSAVPWFDVVEWDGTSQVYCNDTDDFEVLQSGVRLECGHNRQPETDA
jgi:hypothetical protein